MEVAARRSASRRLSFSATLTPSLRFAMASLSQSWRSDFVANASCKAVTISK